MNDMLVYFLVFQVISQIWQIEILSNFHSVSHIPISQSVKFVENRIAQFGDIKWYGKNTKKSLV